MANKVFRIIIAEDERLIAKNIKNMVEQCGNEYQVVALARDGLAALELIESHIPDIVITDIKMPQMDGIQLMHILEDKFPQINKIVVSGYAEFEYAKNAMKENVKDYLLKPIDIAELKHTLEGIKLESFELFDQSTSQEQMAQKIKEYLVKNYDSEIQITDIADRLKYSPSYITKIFKEKYYVSPIQFLRSYRMETAKQLLSSTDFSVAQVAKMVGIPDPFYFSRIFRNTWGITPSDIRKQY